MEKVVQPWNRLPRAVQSHHPCLERFKTFVDVLNREHGLVVALGVLGGIVGLDELRRFFQPKPFHESFQQVLR